MYESRKRKNMNKKYNIVLSIVMILCWMSIVLYRYLTERLTVIDIITATAVITLNTDIILNNIHK